MKDLTHYFVDAVKSSENSVETASEVIEELRMNGNNDQTIKKRGRVKIKISKSDSRGKICKIINNKEDLIDKTPSPLPASSKKTIKGVSKNNLNHTPKSSKLNNKVNDDFNVTEKTEIILDSSCENIFSPVKKNDSLVSTISLSNSPTSVEKEESNAFQILMTRDKPIKSILSSQLTPDNITDEMKNNEDTKNKLKKNKEKLVIGDKRGYSKRKLTDKEDDVTNEQQLENRSKIFKRNSNDNIQNNSTAQGQASKGLHSYFTKIVSDEKKVLQNDSKTDDVKQDESKETCSKSNNYKAEKKNEKSRLRKILGAIDSDQVLKVDDSSSSLVDEQESKERNSNQSKKPRWSLRINLISPDDDDGVFEEDKTSLDGNSNNNNNNNRLMDKKRKSKEKLKKQEANKELKKFEKKTEVSNVNNGSESRDILHNSSEIEVIEMKVLKRPPNEKLAPLFIKRPKPDPEIVAARQLFLHSRSPDQENKKVEKKSIIPKSSVLPFPSVSHINQIEEIKNFTSSDSKHRIKEPMKYVPRINVDDFKFVINLDDKVSTEASKLDNLIKPDPEEVLKEIEGQCDNAREMWTKISTIVKQKNRPTPKKRGRKKKSLNNGTSPVLEINENHADVWTQKFRPLNTKEIIGNEEAAIKLKNWLNSWSVPVNNDDYSSSEEFYSSDNSRSSFAQCSKQVAVLLGPHGSGKTASVYAIAEELGYNVLEVNASSKRTGRIILKDLDEATKSHRFKNPDLKSTFQPNSDDKKIQKNSLILFEDVDIIFDEDEGFVSAAYQLASNTKRPIIMTCRNSCIHLSRMAPQQLRINFQAAQGPKAMAFLDLITLAEAGTRLPQPCVDKLLINGDLRKALLQLQYLLASGTPSTSLLASDFRDTLWQDMRNYLYKPTVKLNKKRIKQKNKINLNEDQDKNEQKLNNQTIIHNLANDLDTISVISSLVDVNDSILNVSQLKFEPSLSLEENMHYYSVNHTRNTEIGEWLRHQTMLKYISDVDDVDHSKVLKQLMLKKELNTGVDLALSQISMNTLDSRIMAVDYLPAVRTICRAEELKSTNNSKRGNRFFHYLHHFRLPAGSLKPNILAAACKVMQEK